jgi:hypothetical protein
MGMIMSKPPEMNKTEQWLSQEDERCRTGRLERLQWLATELPTGEYLTFPGGLMAKFLFEETRYCFAYGQYLAVIVLGVAFIERTLAAEFYASGRNDLERSSISELLREARSVGWLTAAEYDAFDRARKVRNPVTHFRHPGHRENIESRMLEENDYPYTVIEQDARLIAAAVMHMVGRHAV